MRASRFGRLVVVIGCVLGLTALPASAAAPTLGFTSAIRTANKATVSGTAVFPAVTEAVSVGGTNTNFAQPPISEAAGIDLMDARIEPLADNAGLRFIWQLKSMPEQVPPEGVRYTWAFKIGERQYQLQAKRTNLANITTAEDPVGHIKQAAAQKPFFQLRGACVESYEGAPVNGCYHLAFLQGSFNTAAKTVTMDLPFQTRDAIGRLVAEDFKPGAILEESLAATMSITASFQAAVSNVQTSDYTNGWSPYFTGKRVDLAIGSANAEPAGLDYSTPADLSGESFSGSVIGLTNSANTVYARACSAIECTYAKVTPTIG